MTKLLLFLALLGFASSAFALAPIVTATSTEAGFAARGALDRDRFSPGTNHCWKGSPGQAQWSWQVDFQEEKEVGGMLMILSDHSFVFKTRPRIMSGKEAEMDWIGPF